MNGEIRTGDGRVTIAIGTTERTFATPERPRNVSEVDLPFSILADSPQSGFTRFIERARHAEGDVVEIMHAAHVEDVARRMTLVHRRIEDDGFRVAAQGDGLRIRNGKPAQIGQDVVGGVDPVLGRYFETCYRRVTTEGGPSLHFVRLFARDRFSLIGYRELHYRRFLLPIRETRGSHIVGALSVTEPVL